MKKLIAGNWKMNMNVKESVTLVKELLDGLKNLKADTEVLICPPFTSLYSCAEKLKNSPLMLGAQNMSDKDSGAYTGEISRTMLKDLGCTHVIIGHSERRKYYGETNAIVNSKVKMALEAGIHPVMCVGETLQEREDGIFKGIVEEHVIEGLRDLNKDDIPNLTIAYEPVWAIGTGVNATPKQASEMHKFIKKVIAENFGSEARVLYGGSVNASNAKEILSAEGIDGALVGGASLKSNDFLTIVKSAS